MAYVEPTPASLKARFPVFSAVLDAVVQTAIDEAGRRVDQSWPEEDYTLAKSLYAAHVLTLDGQGTSREGKMLGFKSVEIGPIKLERSTSDANSIGTLQSTSFGVRFAELLRANFGGGTAAIGLPNPCDTDPCW